MTILLIFILNFNTLLNKKIQNNYIKSTLGIKYLKLESEIFSKRFNFTKTNQKLVFSTYFKNFYFEYNFNNENFYTNFKHRSKICRIELKSKNFNFISLTSSLNFKNIKIKISKYNFEMELFKKFNNFKVISNLKSPVLFNKKAKIYNKIYYFKERYKLHLNLSNFNKFSFKINLKFRPFKLSINNVFYNKEGNFLINSNFKLIFSYKIQNLKFYLRLHKTFHLSLKATL